MLESILSFGGRLLGGLLGKSSQDDANRIAQENAARQEALQREFAQNSIQWRVADAKKAGLHPLAALGAGSVSYSPVSVGVSGANPLASEMAGMGQDLGRAAAAMRPRGDRADVYTKVARAQVTEGNALDLETKRLNNQLLRARIAQIEQPGTPPGVPFVVPENPKIEQNPKLMIGGSRWDTDPHTSPSKAWEDRYGDEGIPIWITRNVIGARDLIKNLPAIWERGKSKHRYRPMQ